MPLPPPRSPLFPYTTLFRSPRFGEHRIFAAGRPVEGAGIDDDAAERVAVAAEKLRQRVHDDVGARSEEHTSELQSLTNLVCRLLLEKKKKKQEKSQHDSNST